MVRRVSALCAVMRHTRRIVELERPGTDLAAGSRRPQTRQRCSGSAVAIVTSSQGTHANAFDFAARRRPQLVTTLEPRTPVGPSRKCRGQPAL